MKKQLLFFIAFLWFGTGFSQTTISYIQDSKEAFTLESIKNADFKKYEKPINNGLNNGVYWFRISNLSSKKNTIQIPNYRIYKAKLYQGNKTVNPIEKERFLTFQTESNATIYIKVTATREALIPIEVQKTSVFLKKEKGSFLFIGFYYGFAFVIILINLFYYINFKEVTFLYYALFLMMISLGFLISDGIFLLYEVSQKIINSIEVFNHFLVVVFSMLFASSYLQLDNYYPKSKHFVLVLCGFVLLFGCTFLITDNHVYYVIMELFVFTTLIYYWTVALILFKKNLFTKVFVVAYFFILVLGISFYVTKLLGIPVLITINQLKFGGFFEMVLLSFAVIYRMKTLQVENTKMREEIVLYSKEIKSLSEELKKTSESPVSILMEANLSAREQKILHLISEGKTNKEIAEQLNISVNTVKYHVKNIYDKLNIKSRREAQNIAISL
ncbi:LuxR C-terminal-related transcriptional regulator [Polaribacter cellanae]|uniref:Winged helix-turn-helix transcriptional regulator n=1 Tax=Polaribacter cellanae TaxID=2818493 RepID=A0A975H790_9FLAO|nr:LuxR C-terminal-related transcriptional regulator [Polaribacter cellanae]QTE23222.1 winged helix-turn-helix transcriptional regulator [Polaribacter cellanae]